MKSWNLLALFALAGGALSIIPACAAPPDSDSLADEVKDEPTGEASSALVSPLNCPVAGWNFVPYKLSSTRFPYAARATAADVRYANNLDYKWQMWFNQNVTSVKLVFEKGTPADPATGTPPSPGFELESGYDFLTISGNTTVSLTGNLDANNTVEYTTAAVDPSFALGSNDNYVNLEFTSDGSVSSAGWTVKGAWVLCGRTGTPAGASSNVSRLHANGEREGVLLGAGDIRYFSTVQEANQELILNLRPDAKTASHADFDLFAAVGPNTTPGPGSGTATWSSTRSLAPDGSMLDDTIRIPPVNVARYVYFSVYDYSGSGGYRVYDNSIGKIFSFRVGTEFDYKAYNKPAFSGQDLTSLLRNDLYETAGALYEATDATARISQFDLYNNDTTCGGLGCQFVLFSKETCDSWAFWGGAVCVGSGACNFGNTGEKVNVCSWMLPPAAGSAGVVLSHELGHCLYTFGDEYNYTTGTAGGHCGHSVMNGPIWDNNIDYCTDANHLKDPYFPDASPMKPTSNWADMKSCFPSQFTSYYVTGTPDPEAWWSSDIWSTSPGLTTIVEH